MNTLKHTKHVALILFALIFCFAFAFLLATEPANSSALAETTTSTTSFNENPNPDTDFDYAINLINNLSHKDIIYFSVAFGVIFLIACGLTVWACKPKKHKIVCVGAENQINTNSTQFDEKIELAQSTNLETVLKCEPTLSTAETPPQEFTEQTTVTASQVSNKTIQATTFNAVDRDLMMDIEALNVASVVYIPQAPYTNDFVDEQKPEESQEEPLQAPTEITQEPIETAQDKTENHQEPTEITQEVSEKFEQSTEHFETQQNSQQENATTKQIDDIVESATINAEALDDDDLLEENQITIQGVENLTEYRKSFTAKLLQAEPEQKEYFANLADFIVSFGAKIRYSWDSAFFTHDKRTLTKIVLRGKTFYVFLPLNPSDYFDTKYHVRDVSDKKKYSNLPTMVKVKSTRGLKFAKELVDDVMKKEHINQNVKFWPTITADNFPYATTEELIEKKQIKIVKHSQRPNPFAKKSDDTKPQE